MTSSLDKTHRPRSKPRTRPSLNIMVAKGTGKVRTFRVSPRILLMGLIFFILYIPASVLVINNYLTGVQEQETQRGEASRLRAELDEARKTIFRYQQQVAVLREHIENNKTQPVTSLPEMPRIQNSPPRSPKESTVDQLPFGEAVETILPPAADIKDLAIYREGEDLKVTFKIVNLKDVGPLEGYAFVIALDPANSAQALWSYPEAPLREGIPVDHQNGFRFAIRNFKAITMTHKLGTEGEWPPVLRFLVYDSSGKLLRQEEVEVKAEG